MGLIDIYLQKIMSAVKGKDVRDSIHDAIQLCYRESTANGQIELIMQKAQEARETIPPNYTSLSDTVSDISKVQDNHTNRLVNLEVGTAVVESLSRRVKNLEAAADGYLYREEVDANEAYEKSVPPDALPWAMLDYVQSAEVSGKTYTPKSVVCHGRNMLNPANFKNYGNGIISAPPGWAYDLFDGGTGTGHVIGSQSAFNNLPVLTPGYYNLQYESSTTQYLIMYPVYDDYSIGQSLGTSRDGLIMVPTTTRVTIRRSSNASNTMQNVYLAKTDIEMPYVPYHEPITYDVSKLEEKDYPLPIEVEAGGRLTFINQNGTNSKIPLPNQETYMIKVGGVNDA